MARVLRSVRQRCVPLQGSGTRVVRLVRRCHGAILRGPRPADDEMRRLTIRLSAPGHRALKEASARQGRSTGAVIEESLRLGGTRPIDTAREIVARAQARLDPDEATAVVVRETRLRRGDGRLIRRPTPRQPPSDGRFRPTGHPATSPAMWTPLARAPLTGGARR